MTARNAPESSILLVSGSAREDGNTELIAQRMTTLLGASMGRNGVDRHAASTPPLPNKHGHKWGWTFAKRPMRR